MDEHVLLNSEQVLDCKFCNGEGCIVSWGRYNIMCEHLIDVEYKGVIYGRDSEEFLAGFDDVENVLWNCGWSEQTLQ